MMNVNVSQSDPCLSSEDVKCPESHHMTGNVMPINLVSHLGPLFSGLRPFQQGGSSLLPRMADPLQFLLPGAPLQQRQEASDACRCVTSGTNGGSKLARLEDDADDDVIRTQRVAAAPGGVVSTLEGVASAAVDPLGVVGCSEHLQHPLCRPCGERCIGNPFCGAGKAWCRIEGGGAGCHVADKVPLNEPGCVGPYPGHATCESLLLADLASQEERPAVVGADSVASLVVVRPSPLPSPSSDASRQARVALLQRRCDAQERLYNQGACPRPSDEQLASARAPPDEEAVVFVRHCNAAPVQTLGSFIRHVMDGFGPQLDGAAKAFQEAEEEMEEEMGRSPFGQQQRNHSLAMLLVPKSQRHKVVGAQPAGTSEAPASLPSGLSETQPLAAEAVDVRMQQKAGTATAPEASEGVVPVGVAGGDAHVGGSAAAEAAGAKQAGAGVASGGRAAVPAAGIRLSTKLDEASEGASSWWAWLVGSWWGWIAVGGMLSAVFGVLWYGKGASRAGRHRMPRQLWGGRGGSAGRGDGAGELDDPHGVFEDGNHSTGLFEAFEHDDGTENDADGGNPRFRG